MLGDRGRTRPTLGFAQLLVAKQMAHELCSRAAELGDRCAHDAHELEGVGITVQGGEGDRGAEQVEHHLQLVVPLLGRV
jgi:hypothetical protein